MNSKNKKILFGIFTFVFLLIFIEIGLWVATLFSAKVEMILARDPSKVSVAQIPQTVEDKVLGWRPNPEIPEHDEKGFRNKQVPNKTSILALGDSQTYGTGVSADENWTSQLAKMTNKNVYNLAYGGYGPTQSLVLLEEGLELKPEIVIGAFYSGNDLFDCFSFVYTKNQLQELKSEDEKIVKLVDSLETNFPLQKEVQAVFKGFVKQDSLAKKVVKKGFSVKEFLAENSKFYGVFRAFKRLSEQKQKNLHWDSIKKVEAKNEGNLIFESPKANTVLTPNYRLLALNLNDPRLQEGLRISLEAIKKQKEKTEKNGAEFYVLLIPTKELVFRDLYFGSFASVPRNYSWLIECETKFRKTARNFFNQNSINYIDSLPALKKALQKGKNPYKQISDGHPNSIGQKVIAEVVFSELIKHFEKN